MSTPLRPPTPAAGCWDVFCKVVDNYGDIGVCWRLCRSLAREHGVPVRLIVDRPDLLQRIGGDPADFSDPSTGAGIRVARWCNSVTPEPETAVVVEAFACELPEAYVRRMASDARARLWINLEYLSAERWIEDCHGLVSRHPQFGLDKRFVFPGFTGRSAGLLREADLRHRRDRFRSDPSAQAAAWRSLGVEPPGPGERRASLFGYENPAVVDLLGVLSDGEAPWTVLVPEGRSCAELSVWAGLPFARPGDTVTRDSLQLRVVPFTPQDDYDRLLWACDLNLVRGEDSLVRALWAGRPFLWQAYPQTDGAHLDKVAALLARFPAIAEGGPVARQYAAAMRAWNGDATSLADWSSLQANLSWLAEATESWSLALDAGRELAESLVKLSQA